MPFLVTVIIIISHNLQNLDNCDTNLLMKAYNLGYNLLFKNDFYKNNHETIPLNIFLKNKKTKVLIMKRLKKHTGKIWKY